MSEKPQWRCGTCKHNDSGQCLRIKGPQHQSYRDWFDDDDACVLDKEPAYCFDGSDYHAGLAITDDFGCVLWEQKRE